MRGFGAGKRRVLASFFLEQAILSITGCISILIIGKTNLMELLSVRE